MNKELYLKSLLLTAFVMIGSLTAFASYDFMVDEIYYTINADGFTVSVSGIYSPYNSYEADITIPETVTYNGVTYLVTAIGKRAFEERSYLKSIEIPNTVTSIGEYAFLRCSSITSITLPDSINSIGEGAFYGCSGIRTVTIPNTITTINDWLFSDCTNLTYVTLGDSVTSIGGCAFDFCSNLRSVNIPSTVTSIGNSAFRGCSSLSCKIVIPKAVINMGENPFTRCASLTDIQVEEGNPKYDSRDNCNALIETSSNTLISGFRTTIIPNTVSTIGTSAFCGLTGMKTKKIPNSVITIGRNAFGRCSDLESIIIPNSVTHVESSAFYSCNKLKKVTIGSSVVNLNDAFSYSYSVITSIICLAMTPPQISSFESSVYSNAVLQVPEDAVDEYRTTYPWRKFSYIQSLDLNHFEVDGIYYHSLDNSTVSVTYKDTNYNSYSGEVVIPKTISYDKTYNVVAIDGFAFRDSKSLTSITIPRTITSIGENAFYGCNNLARLSVENGNPAYDSRGNCNAVIETASNALISGCKNTIIPNTITTIGEFAFYGRAGLTDINIPNSVTKIDTEAFTYCPDLTSVTIGNSVNSIGFLAFCACDKLATITCNAPVPPVMERDLNCFDSSTLSTAILRVPYEYFDAYKADRFWSEFLHIVPFIGAGPGDVDGDGNINISDVTALIDLLINGGEALPSADVDGDGQVNISDVTAIIDMLLSVN